MPSASTASAISFALPSSNVSRGVARSASLPSGLQRLGSLIAILGHELGPRLLYRAIEEELSHRSQACLSSSR